MGQTVVLYCQKNSVYKTLDCDVYDLDRDARTYLGNQPVIAHPPCRLFSRLRKFSTADPEEKKLAYHALEHIQKYGGILEHPMGSILWKEKNMFNDGIGITISVDQHWFGHVCRKRTWLYIVGCELQDIPAYPLKFELVKSDVSSVSHYYRSYTPEKFALWLIDIINTIKLKKCLEH